VEDAEVSSNLPPGETGGGRTEEILHRCKNGHEAKIPMHYELGGWFYFKESDGECPTCHDEWIPDGHARVIPTIKPKSARPPATPRAGLATVLGLLAAVSSEQEAPRRAQEIRHGEACTRCGEIGGHSDDCKPPRGFRKV
jgi:hypothetical protein